MPVTQSLPLLIGIPTRDSTMVIGTMLELIESGHGLGRPVQFVSSEASNVPRARNIVVAQIRANYAAAVHPWVLWIDSDIIIAPGGHVAIVDALRWAEEHETPIVANYLMADGQSVVMLGPDRHQVHHGTREEITELANYAEVQMTGFGFLYIRHPLSYVFHADLYGEDIHFWWDNPEIQPHLAKQITLGHQKTVVLGDYRIGGH